jgi:DNA-binding response OmpR family regulator
MPKQVLLVDDSRTALLLGKMVIAERTSYEIRTASDGQDAVEKAKAETPDLILMDVVMPRKNGFEACRELRQHAATASVPIILLTTRGEAECVETGFVNGCNDYLTKPINPDELVNMLEAYLGN